MGAVGLRTHIWNNNLLSIAMLFVLPIALVLWFWGFFMAWQVFTFVVFPIGLGQVILDGFWVSIFSGMVNSFYTVTNQLPMIIVITLVWYGVAFLYNVQIIRKATGAKGVERKEEFQLYNLLENLTISRTMAMVKLSIIETDALNAFASGIDKNSYNITVTRGLINALSKNELEAVLAHELTHIENNDTRLMMIITIFSGALMMMIDFIKSMFGDRSNDMGRLFSDKPRSVDARLGVLMGGILVMTLLSSFISNFVQYFVSRKRAFMADAGSVERTNQPDALVTALVKIEGNGVIPSISSAMSTLFIMPVTSKKSMFRSHPTLERRVEALRNFAGAIVTKADIKTLKTKFKEKVVLRTKKEEQKPETSWKTYRDRNKKAESKA